MSLKLAFALILCVQVQASLAFAQPGHGGGGGRGGEGPPEAHGGGYNPGPQPGGNRGGDDSAADDAAGAAEAGVLIIGLLYDLYQQHEADQAEQTDEQQQEQQAEDVARARAIHQKYDNDLCAEIYSGKFKSGDSVSVDLGADAQAIRLNDSKSGTSYNAKGSCTVSQDLMSATIKFALVDDARYTFTGKATRQTGNGKGFDFGMVLSEFKSGKAIDQISAAR